MHSAASSASREVALAEVQGEERPREVDDEGIGREADPRAVEGIEQTGGDPRARAARPVAHEQVHRKSSEEGSEDHDRVVRGDRVARRRICWCSENSLGDRGVAEGQGPWKREAGSLPEEPGRLGQQGVCVSGDDPQCKAVIPVLPLPAQLGTVGRPEVVGSFARRSGRFGHRARDRNRGPQLAAQDLLVLKGGGEYEAQAGDERPARLCRPSRPFRPSRASRAPAARHATTLRAGAAHAEV